MRGQGNVHCFVFCTLVSGGFSFRLRSCPSTFNPNKTYSFFSFLVLGGGDFLVFSRISFRVGKIETALRSRSSLSDFCMLPYFSFQEWFSCRVGCCSSG